MRQITNSIKCLIVFGIWLLGFNTLYVGGDGPSMLAGKNIPILPYWYKK